MSVNNVIVGDNRVAIVTDTVGYYGRKPLDFNRKVEVYPDSRLACAVRGYRWIGKSIRGMRGFRNFDVAVEGLYALADQTPDLAEEYKLPLGDGFEIALVGWQDGPRACRLTYWTDYDRIDVEELEPGATYLSPSLGRQTIPADLTDDQIRRISHLQQQVSIKNKLNMCIGGDVEIAEVTADGATIRTLGEYPDKELTTRRMVKTKPTVLLGFEAA